jgi:hypothetical protein
VSPDEFLRAFVPQGIVPIAQRRASEGAPSPLAQMLDSRGNVPHAQMTADEAVAVLNLDGALSKLGQGR